MEEIISKKECRKIIEKMEFGEAGDVYKNINGRRYAFLLEVDVNGFTVLIGIKRYSDSEKYITNRPSKFVIKLIDIYPSYYFNHPKQEVVDFDIEYYTNFKTN